MGRSGFTRAEIKELRRLIGEKQTADRSRQKTLRSRMRRMDFYISDFSADSAGFVVSDLDDLISRGVITVADHDGLSTPEATPTAGEELSAVPRSRSLAAPRGQPRGDELERFVADAQGALARDNAQPIAEAAARIPSRPGLYAIQAAAVVWKQLGLGEPPDERPLYVGKAESSLVSRDVGTHFGDGRTGSSTVRRSFAALLREPLGLEGRPRNPAKPERPANFGLSPDHDKELTTWMGEHLTIAVWPTPEDCAIALFVIENELLQRLLPPLNLKDVVTPWTAQVKAARKVLADQARRWTEAM